MPQCGRLLGDVCGQLVARDAAGEEAGGDALPLLYESVCVGGDWMVGGFRERERDR